MALLLARRYRRFPSAPSLIRFFSNSSSDPPPKSANASVEKPPQSQSNSPFTDIKSTLKNNSSQARNHGSSRISGSGSSQDLSINLAKFQRRSAAPPPKSESPSTSFETLYKQNVAAGANSSDPSNLRGHDIDLSKLRENLKNLKSQPNTEMAGMSLRRRNVGSSDVSVIGKDMEDGNGREGETEEEVTMTEYLKMYREEELGEKLKMLRPEGKKEDGWFSLEELNERLVKLRQAEKKEVKNQRWNFSVLRNVIGTLEDDKAKNEAVPRMFCLCSSFRMFYRIYELLFIGQFYYCSFVGFCLLFEKLRSFGLGFSYVLLLKWHLCHLRRFLCLQCRI